MSLSNEPLDASAQKLLAILLLVMSCGIPAQQDHTRSLPKVVDFNFHIKPLLSDRCYACHGPDENAREGEVRLDKEAYAFKLLDSISGRHVIKPGNLSRSEVYQRIVHQDKELKMPPLGSNLSLTEYEIALVKKWIQQGAEWKPHWSFIPPRKSPLPEVVYAEWPSSDIDYFILAKLESLGKVPSGQAKKEKLLRRLSFDLTGLPPSPEDIETFLSDENPDAFESWVDTYLTSVSYAERMATEWIDLARYAETNGIHHDFERNMWPWRDWVIQAFQKNMPYDQFVMWQLAGDLLPDPSYDQQLATAFNRNHRTTQECGSLDEEFRVSYVIDRTNTFGKAFLGLTVECAQCHDHKYDPISQKEYYQLSAFFNQVPEKGVTKSFQGQSAPYLPLPADEVEQIREYIDHQIETEYTHGSKQDKDKSYLSNWKDEMEAMLQPVMIMEDQDTLRPTYILDRGLYDSPTEEVSFGTPEAIFSFDPNLPKNRLGLSRWLFDRENPLTARVVVNRYWQMIFGRGLVKTPDDFGNQGALPSHPALLDHLAVAFIESGWDVMALLKRIVMSATYQQSSVVDEDQLIFDPENKWLGRGAQQRLSAEMIRDQILKMSGLLNSKVGGPSVKPYQPEGLWTQVSSGGRYTRKYMTAHGQDRYRRSLYTYWKRTQPPPAMVLFDAASRNQCTVQRQSTNTPLQALVLLNDPQFVEASRAMAQRLLSDAEGGIERHIEQAFRYATSRKPDQEEVSILKIIYSDALEEFRNHPQRVNDFLSIGEFPIPNHFDKPKLAAYAVLVNAIINLSESLQKN